MKAVTVLVSFDLLREALHLPLLTDIRFVGTSDFGIAEIVIEHPDLPDVAIVEGQRPPIATPTFRKQEPIVFVDWGLK